MKGRRTGLLRRGRRRSGPAVSADHPPTEITLLTFEPSGALEEIKVEKDLSGIAPVFPENRVVWLNIDGSITEELLNKIGRRFNVHPLVIEDVLHLGQRPKLERYEDALFITARMLRPNRGLETEQLSMFLRRNLLVTFQEQPGGDCFDRVRERLRAPVSRLRTHGADYLAYSLLDAVIDAYFPLIEQSGDTIEAIEELIYSQPRPMVLAKIHDAKQELLALRRAVWPLREVVSSLIRDDYEAISEETRLYLRDCYDHTVQIIELMDIHRELSSDLTDLYMSTLSNRMNEVMKLLTIITTFFMPLTFIAGVYGMNFNTERSAWNMPELNWVWGYPFALSLMLLSTALLWWYFRRRKWV